MHRPHVAAVLALAVLTACGGGGGSGAPPEKPVIGTQPQSQAVVEGHAATFTVAATGSDLTYQWSRDGADIAGATSASYALASPTTGDSGAAFRVTVTNAGGAVTSDPATLSVNPAHDDAAENWVGTWACAPYLSDTTDLTSAPMSGKLSNLTLRQIVHASIGGDRIRLRLSNQYGTKPVEILSAHVALSSGTTTIVVGSDRALTFDGVGTVTIPVGQEVTSDSIALTVPAVTNVAISLAFGSAVPNFTGHAGSRTNTYIVAGNRAGDQILAGSTRVAHWYYIEGLEVVAPETSRAVAVLGDSITDGRGSTTDAQNRWPDVLAGRLAQDDATREVAVLNLGVGGNNLLTGGSNLKSGKDRFDHDILGQKGVKWAIVFMGVNDIGGGATSDALIAGYQQLVAEAHAAGLLVYGVPITPFGLSSYDDTPNHTHLATRDTVNAWIRGAGHFDGVIDFDPTVADAAHPTQIDPAYLFENDHLHFNADGYAAMGQSIDLSLFQ